jgi:hypothetical protein
MVILVLPVNGNHGFRGMHKCSRKKEGRIIYRYYNKPPLYRTRTLLEEYLLLLPRLLQFPGGHLCSWWGSSDNFRTKTKQTFRNQAIKLYTEWKYYLQCQFHTFSYLQIEDLNSELLRMGHKMNWHICKSKYCACIIQFKLQ